MKKFWDKPLHPDNLAVINHSDGSLWTYSQLMELTSKVRKALNYQNKSLGFILCKNDVEALAGYLASLQSGHGVALLGADLNPELLHNLVSIYQPDWIYFPDTLKSYLFPGSKPTVKLLRYTMVKRTTESQGSIHPDLAILLSTSGSTGSPKLVRLSWKNIQANAHSIAQYLGLNTTERPVTTLPMQYSYGLSVINSHLLVEASILMTDKTFFDREFWDFFKNYHATSIAGVPYNYEILHRLKFDQIYLPSLKTMTQAGGRLAENLVKHFNEYALQNHIKFFVMYGQTEATARISYVPPNLLSHKIGSIGKAIPGGALSINPQDNELIYRGPNVMMGYAKCREDLSKGDELNGILPTGDIVNFVDEDGFYYLAGRKKRFIKMFGQRISLDDIETYFAKKANIHLICLGVDDQLFLAIPESQQNLNLTKLVSETFNIHPKAIKTLYFQDIPRLSTGKINYSELQKHFEDMHN